MDGHIEEIGLINTLTVNRLSPPGAFLKLDNGEVLLPNKFVTEGLKPGDEVEAFLYTDSEDRIVATTQVPKGVLNDFVALEVVDVLPFGAFLDWGLDKHLLIPTNEMESPLQIGDVCVVKIVLDYRTNRLIGVSKLRAFMKSAPDLAGQDQVRGLVVKETPLGYNVLVDDQFVGLLYKNEVVNPPAIGAYVDCYVKKVREDGKIDLMLRLPGKDTIDDDAQSILNKLKANDGMLPFSDKSDPNEINAEFGLSKKAFKRAIGSLYKEKMIMMEPGKIRLIQPEAE